MTLGPVRSRAALAALIIAAIGPALGGARVIDRPARIPDAEPRIRMPWQKKPGRRSNEPKKLSAKARQRRNAKIARASRRANLRRSL